MKLMILPDAFVDKEYIKTLFENESIFELVSNWNQANVLISGSFPDQYIPQVTMPNFPLNKLCYMTSEPAICFPRTYFYNNFHKMFLVACYNPKNNNEIPITIDNKHGAEFPFPIVPFGCEAVTRKDITMKNRGIFLAGELSLESDESPHGFINIKKLRRQFTEYLLNNPNNYVCGKGTPRGKTCLPDGSNVRIDKQNKIMESDCDFVMALENSIYPDYITEKIGEGFTSDRVTLYLGAPNIENHVPRNCYIDLRKWFNVETKQFNFKEFQDYINNLSQEEYDSYILNAREFRKNSKEKYEANLKYLTNAVVDRIKKYI